MESVNKFLDYLEKNKFYNMNPTAFNEMQIISFAYSQGFHFTREALQTKLNQLAQYKGDLNKIEENWRVL